jgi:hypothetical protein
VTKPARSDSAIRKDDKTENPCLLALRAKGYTLKLDYTIAAVKHFRRVYHADKAGQAFIASSPEELLGLVAMWEVRGDEWQTAPNEPSIYDGLARTARIFGPDGEEVTGQPPQKGNPFSDGWTMEDVKAVLERADPQELLYVPIVVSMDPPDCGWSEAICVQLSAHAHEDVRGNAILGFGHLARTCRKLNEQVVKPIIEAGLRDPSRSVRGQADAAADDVQHFLGWRVKLPE